MKLTLLEELFQPVLAERGFQIVEEHDIDSRFAALRILGSDKLKVRFEIDREHPYIEIAAPDSTQWCSLSTLHRLLCGEWLAGDRNEKVQQMSRFMATHYDEIAALFTEEQVEKTITQAHDLEAEWRREYFRKE